MEYVKYYLYNQQVSYDQGQTWINTELYVPSGDPIGTYNTLEECENGLLKYVLTLNDSSTVSATCDSSSTISSSEIYPYYGTLVSAEIKECATRIDFGAFGDCQYLSSVTIPNSVTSMTGAEFSNCRSLKDITIPNSVSGGTYLTFNNCVSLTSATLSDNTTSIGMRSFYDCFVLTGITIPSSVTSIGENAFDSCASLTSVTIPNNVTEIGSQAFYNCESLTSITCLASTPPALGNNAFDRTGDCPIYVPCDSLSAYQSAWSIYSSRLQCIPKFKLVLRNNNIVTAACDSSSSLTRTEISAYSASVTSAIIGNCVSSIGDQLFLFCKYLKDVTMLYGVTHIGSTAFTTSSLKSVIIPDSVTSIGNSAFQQSGISGITIPNSVTSIGNQAFYGCSGLTSIKIPDSVTSIDQGIFSRCSGLTSVSIGSGITHLNTFLFLYCIGLTSVGLTGSGASVEIPNSVTNLGGSTFQGCSGLTSVTISKYVTEIGAQAFQDCSGLTSITVLASWPPNLGYGSVFANTNDCPIYVPYGLSGRYKAYWSQYKDRIRELPLFKDKWIATYAGGTTSSTQCDSTSAISQNEISLINLLEVQIGGCVTSIGDSAFLLDWDTYSSFTSITIGENVENIGFAAFAQCSGLTTVIIPNSVTSIGSSAFDKCFNLSYLTIGSKVTNIGAGAFYGCYNLINIKINAATPPSLGNYAFDDTGDCPIYVPEESVNAYKAAEGWNNYADRIKYIP